MALTKATFLHSWWLCRSVPGLKSRCVHRTTRSCNCKASVRPQHLKNTLINTTVTERCWTALHALTRAKLPPTPEPAASPSRKKKRTNNTALQCAQHMQTYSKESFKPCHRDTPPQTSPLQSQFHSFLLLWTPLLGKYSVFLPLIGPQLPVVTKRTRAVPVPLRLGSSSPTSKVTGS